MTEHLASAHMRLNKPVFNEAMESIARELYNTKFKSVPAPLRSFVGAFESAFNVRIVNKGGLDLFEYVMHRGLIGGGQEMANYLEDQIMNHLFKNTAIFTPPAGMYVALWTAATGEANNSGTEVTGGAYARQQVLVAGWAAISNGATSNSNDIDYGTATANWGTILDATLEAAASGAGNRYFYSPLTASKTVNNGDSFKILAGQLTASID